MTSCCWCSYHTAITVHTRRHTYHADSRAEARAARASRPPFSARRSARRAEGVAVELVQHANAPALDRRRTRLVVQQRQLAKGAAWLVLVHGRVAHLLQVHAKLARAHDEEVLPVIAQAEPARGAGHALDLVASRVAPRSRRGSWWEGASAVAAAETAEAEAWKAAMHAAVSANSHAESLVSAIMQQGRKRRRRVRVAAGGRERR